ncbi:hypothetical protein C8J57DRAFT_1707295 [Mycena rebaudengoi]|nr:hypothetical protein C8J57DRAFT_1707295 [Mycena rebaudengoi]
MSHRTQSPVQRLDPLRNIWLDIAARAHAVCSTSERRILSERHCTSVASCQGVNVLKCALEDARHWSSIHIHVEEEACDLIAEYYMYRDHLLNVVVLHIAIWSDPLLRRLDFQSHSGTPNSASPCDIFATAPNLREVLLTDEEPDVAVVPFLSRSGCQLKGLRGASTPASSFIPILRACPTLLHLSLDLESQASSQTDPLFAALASSNLCPSLTSLRVEITTDDWSGLCSMLESRAGALHLVRIRTPKQHVPIPVLARLQKLRDAGVDMLAFDSRPEIMARSQKLRAAGIVSLICIVRMMFQIVRILFQIQTRYNVWIILHFFRAKAAPRTYRFATHPVQLCTKA